jgi:hypothetical protein
MIMRTDVEGSRAFAVLRHGHGIEPLQAQAGPCVE